MLSNPKSVAILALLVLGVGVLFWPTLYRYDEFGSGDASLPMRINRVTGRAQLFDGASWMEPEPRRLSARRDTARRLSPPEMQKVSGRGRLDGIGYFNADIYNGSGCTVTVLYLTVTPKDSRGQAEFRRTFRQVSAIEPLSTESVSFKAGTAASLSNTEWTIDSALGSCQQSTASPNPLEAYLPVR